MQANEGPRQPTQATEVAEGSSGGVEPPGKFFSHFFSILLTNANDMATTQANDDPRRPTRANAGQYRPTRVNEGPRRPTMANAGQHEITQATEVAGGSRYRRLKPPGMFFFLFSILLTNIYLS